VCFVHTKTKRRCLQDQDKSPAILQTLRDFNPYRHSMTSQKTFKSSGMLCKTAVRNLALAGR